mmetsp:Transcript_8821/g.20067  ORF Transcript_8821/g.20067 Transcript_8821/m.20067 type:complete len:224 (-) Transcript_8821:785-1456(-)
MLEVLRAGDAAALGPAVCDRVAVGLDHLHGLLHLLPPPPPGALRRLRARTRRHPRAGADGGGVGLHLARRAAAQGQQGAAGSARPHEARVQLLVPRRPARVRQGSDPEPPHLLPLQPCRDLPQEALAALHPHQRPRPAQQREDVQVDGQLQDPQAGHRRVLGRRHALRPGAGGRRQRGRELRARRGERGDPEADQRAAVCREVADGARQDAHGPAGALHRPQL